MRILDFITIEKMIFEDESVYHLFPAHCMSYFETWKLSKRMPMFRQLGKAAVLDLLNGISSETVNKLEKHYGERIVLQRLHYNIVREVKIPINDSNEACKFLCEVDGFDNFSTWRDADFLYVCFWR